MTYAGKPGSGWSQRNYDMPDKKEIVSEEGKKPAMLRL